MRNERAIRPPREHLLEIDEDPAEQGREGDRDGYGNELPPDYRPHEPPRRDEDERAQ